VNSSILEVKHHTHASSLLVNKKDTNKQWFREVLFVVLWRVGVGGTDV
jgi:hypothetical protein